MSNFPDDCCPKCGAKEMGHGGPRTGYICGSSDYDRRPGTFIQSEECKRISNKLN